jgi:peptidyl-prolyl cis-trans isomerase B (cyclophilin B)
MRRLLVLPLSLLVLLLAACGDDQESTGNGGDSAATTAETTAAETTSTGCKAAEEPKPKQVGKQQRPTLKLKRGTTYTAVLQTSCGVVEIELAAESSPKTAGSFISLVRAGFYDGLSFHRIVPGFVVQGGDPAGTGEGGPGYEVVEAPPEEQKYTAGVVAMAKTELDEAGTSGSQFFIVTAPDAGLPAEYAVLGRVAKGDDVVQRLGEVPNDPADNKPTEPVVIEKATIRES